MVISIKFYNYFNFFFNFWPLSFQNTHCEFFFFTILSVIMTVWRQNPPAAVRKVLVFTFLTSFKLLSRF